MLTVCGIATISMYNGLVRIRITCRESWADTDTKLQRRHDLIPNLVSSVKGYSTHEKELLKKVVELRNQAVDARQDGPDARAGIEDMQQGSVGKLIATAEAYPDLNATRASWISSRKSGRPKPGSRGLDGSTTRMSVDSGRA